jgi:hypothetical protein
MCVSVGGDGRMVVMDRRKMDTPVLTHLPEGKVSLYAVGVAGNQGVVGSTTGHVYQFAFGGAAGLRGESGWQTIVK